MTLPKVLSAARETALRRNEPMRQGSCKRYTEPASSVPQHQRRAAMELRVRDKDEKRPLQYSGHSAGLQPPPRRRKTAAALQAGDRSGGASWASAPLPWEGAMELGPRLPSTCPIKHSHGQAAPSLPQFAQHLRSLSCTSRKASSASSVPSSPTHHGRCNHRKILFRCPAASVSAPVWSLKLRRTAC